MATTVIDALIVTLGLDPRNFSAEQKKTASEFTKTRKQLEEDGKKSGAAVNKLNSTMGELQKRVIGLFAAFTAGRGLREFIEDTVEANADLFRFAQTVDMTVGGLSQIQSAVVLIGGTAGAASGSIRGFINNLTALSVTGQSSIAPLLRSLNINPFNEKGQVDIQKSYLELSRKLATMDPQKAFYYGSQLGLDEGTINLLRQGPEIFKKYLDQATRFGTVTEEQARAMAQLQFAFRGLELSSESMGRQLLTLIAPAIGYITTKLTDLTVFMRQHQPLMVGFFVALAVAASFLALALLAPFAEILALTAVVLALGAVFALVYDDWQTWANGGKSLFGDFWNFMKALFTGSGQDIRNTWSKMWEDMVTVAVNILKTIGPKIVSALSDAAKSVPHWVAGRINSLSVALTGRNLIAMDQDKNGGKAFINKDSIDRIHKDWIAPAGRAANAVGSAFTGNARDSAAWQAAIISQQQTGIPAEVSYAQWAIESTHGKNMPAGSNNPFGIKAVHGQQGVWAWTHERDRVTGITHRVMGYFRVFKNMADAFTAHAQLLAHSHYYAAARAAAAGSSDPALAFADHLQNYATAAEYSATIHKFIETNRRAHLHTAGPGGTHVNTHSEVHIGTLNVNAPHAKDAHGVAAGMASALKTNKLAQQANGGPS